MTSPDLPIQGFPITSHAMIPQSETGEAYYVAYAISACNVSALECETGFQARTTVKSMQAAATKLIRTPE